MRRVLSSQQSLDAAFARAKGVDISDGELRADLARYLCIRISGHLEHSVKIFTELYVSRRSAPTVTNFVVKSISKLTNLSCDKLANHLLSMDKTWEDRLSFVLADERKAAVNSVVSLRHNFAHGKSDDITIARVETYYREVLRVLEDVRKIMMLDGKP